MTPPLLDIDIRSHAKGGVRILQGVRQRIEHGEVIALVGASGSGKSSLLRILAGLEQHHEGRILLEGVPLRGLTRDIGVIFEQPRLFPWLTVAENVAFDIGSSLRRLPAVSARVAALLCELALSAQATALPSQLSAGQAQRVAIARGLFARPKLILLDDICAGLETTTRMALQDRLLAVATAHQTALLLVTHDIAEATCLADRVWVLENHTGRLAADVPIALPRPRQRHSAALAERHYAVLHALQSAYAI